MQDTLYQFTIRYEYKICLSSEGDMGEARQHFVSICNPNTAIYSALSSFISCLVTRTMTESV